MTAGTSTALPSPAGTGALPHNLVRFARLLRAAGLPVGPGELADFGRALGWIDLSRRRQVRAAARALLIHRREDVALFDRLFDDFFAAPGRRPRPRPRRPSRKRSIPEPGRRTLFHLMSAGRGEDELEQELRDRSGLASTEETLRRKDFSALTDDELTHVRRLVETLRLPVAERVTRRFEAANDGGGGRRLDLRRVLRDAARHGGTPLRLAYRKPKIKPRPLVVLADVSGSMERYSRLLLHLLYALMHSRSPIAKSGSVRPVEAFAFGTRLTRLTPDLAVRNVDRAVAAAAARVVDWSGGTRIADSLAAFRRDWSRQVLRRGAVVLLVSDGCERGDPRALATEVARLRRRCDRLIWLNPLAGKAGFEPRVAGLAASLPFVDDLLPLHNFESLAHLGRELSRLGKPRARKEMP